MSRLFGVLRGSFPIWVLLGNTSIAKTRWVDSLYFVSHKVFLGLSRSSYTTKPYNLSNRDIYNIHLSWWWMCRETRWGLFWCKMVDPWHIILKCFKDLKRIILFMTKNYSCCIMQSNIGACISQGERWPSTPLQYL